MFAKEESEKNAKIYQDQLREKLGNIVTVSVVSNAHKTGCDFHVAFELPGGKVSLDKFYAACVKVSDMSSGAFKLSAVSYDSFDLKEDCLLKVIPLVEPTKEVKIVQQTVKAPDYERKLNIALGFEKGVSLRPSLSSVTRYEIIFDSNDAQYMESRRKFKQAFLDAQRPMPYTGFHTRLGEAKVYEIEENDLVYVISFKSSRGSNDNSSQRKYSKLN